MLKIILKFAAIMQLFISTSLEVIGNERGSVAVDPPQEQAPTEEPTQTEQPVDKKQIRNDIMREMSKEYGFNLFDADGIKEFQEYTESRKTETEKLQGQVDTLTSEKTTWETKERDYQAKLKAVELGINPAQVDDALKLADNDPSKLEDVLKKYPSFKSGNGITIGKQNPNSNSQPTGDTEAEKYMAQNPRLYKK